MSGKIDITNMRFGRLTVTHQGDTLVKRNGGKVLTWWCLCDCGKSVMVASNNLRSGNSKSCGCLHNELLGAAMRTHDKSKSRIYKIWSNMITRCNNPNTANFHNYGGRGIFVCDRWLKFDAFYEDMGEGYSDDLFIDRINNNSGYFKENCRWVTKKENCLNTRSNRFIEVGGVRKTRSQWAEELGCDQSTIGRRVRLGWSEEKAVTTPVARR